MNYKDYLSSLEWRALVVRVKERDKTCVLCNSTVALQVHHRTYERVGCERLEDLTTLCSVCHHHYSVACQVKRPTPGSWKDEIDSYRPLTPEETTEAAAKLRRTLGWDDASDSTTIRREK